MLLRQKKIEELQNLKASIKVSFNAAKEEMKDHLDGINRNTEEIQGIYDYLYEIDAKLDKLGERIEEVEMLVNPNQEISTSKLNRREQEVFMSLYTCDRISPSEISKKLGFTEDMVLNYVYNLVARGIPITKEYIGEEMFLSLNNKFKDLQAKKNILKVNEL